MRIIFIFAVLLQLSTDYAYADFFVAAHPIRAHTILATNDVELVEGDSTGAFDTIEEILGFETKVAIYPGQPILEGQLGPRAIVERNEIVALVFYRNGLTISTVGRALDRGGTGEVIRVMNQSSKNTLFGRVMADGTIEVGQ